MIATEGYGSNYVCDPCFQDIVMAAKVETVRSIVLAADNEFRQE